MLAFTGAIDGNEGDMMTMILHTTYDLVEPKLLVDKAVSDHSIV